jgi:hypothetical protein
MELVLKWLKGDLVLIDGRSYVFPHGRDKIRKMIGELK